MQNSSKIIAIVSYLTFVGWIIALIMRQSEQPRSDLSRYHLRQALGLNLLGFVGWIVIAWLSGLLGFWLLLNAFRIVLLIFWVLGIVNAIQEELKPLPFIGQWFEDTFDFIK